MLKCGIILKTAVLECNMELLQLKYFCDAAISENFSQTAKKFGVPPSDISQSIKRLEAELGAPLFSRRANSISLNEKGKDFYLSISGALAIISDAVVAVSKEEQSAKIKICINSNRRIVMETIEKYGRLYPNVEIITNHFTDPSADEFDVIIDSENQSLSGFDKRVMISEQMMLAIRRDSQYINDGKFDIALLSELPFVCMSEKSSLHRITNEICRDHGVKPRVVMQCDDPFYVRKCVELGLGATLVPSVSWQGQFSEDVILISLGNYNRVTYVYTDKTKYKPQCVKNFLEML